MDKVREMRRKGDGINVSGLWSAFSKMKSFYFHVTDQKIKIIFIFKQRREESIII